MATLTIRAAPIELGIFEDQWQAVTEELEAVGHDVTIADRMEQRGGLPPVDAQDAATVVIVVALVARKLAGEMLDAVTAEIVAAVRRHLRRRLRGNPSRRVVVVDERGEPLAEVDVPDDEE